MLLAQVAAPVVQESNGFGVLAFFLVGGGAVLAFIILLVVLGLRHARRDREMAHTERMKAIEAGFPLEEPTSSRAKFLHNAFWISFWMVTLVPSAAFWAAAAVTREAERPLSFVIVVWLGAAAAAIAGVVGATTLMLSSRGAPRTLDVPLGKGKLEKELYA